MLFRQLNAILKVDFVAQAPVGQEWELLPQKTITKTLSMKEDAAKFAKKMDAQDKEDEAKHGTSNDEWAEEMGDVYESEIAPAEIQEMFDHQDSLGKNKAMFVLADGTVSERNGCWIHRQVCGWNRRCPGVDHQWQLATESKKLLLKHQLQRLWVPNQGKDSMHRVMRSLGSPKPHR